MFAFQRQLHTVLEYVRAWSHVKDGDCTFDFDIAPLKEARNFDYKVAVRGE